ncbi:hypothetical protein L579_3642 [Pantoea sp. AS-PWVM4]|nr:hypothetical protein L579_3642 [Pantoea sp. AS-PWVM4]
MVNLILLVWYQFGYRRDRLKIHRKSVAGHEFLPLSPLVAAKDGSQLHFAEKRLTVRAG